MQELLGRIAYLGKMRKGTVDVLQGKIEPLKIPPFFLVRFLL
jgi:hypothetical protein